MTSLPSTPTPGDLARFVTIAVQLALLLAVFWLYQIEEPSFFVLAVAMFGGFCVSYWLPIAWKEPFFVAISILGAFFLTDPVVVAAVLGIAGVFFGISRMRATYRLRAGMIIVLFLALLVARRYSVTGVPPALWPTVGAVFMFRFMVFLYDLRNLKTAPTFTEFGAYFLMLPNYYFLIFPVIDFQTMRKSFGRRNVADVAQQGVWWIVRGTIQLVLYRMVVAIKPEADPSVVTSLPLLIENMVLTYLLYLQFSGAFHIIVGMLRLFGYDLPETNRRYLLASSITDFWRRINIYWKDFMVKVFYFPVFFRFRKSGSTRAQVIATVGVFLATWALHSYQYYWLTGTWLLRLTDVLFWAALAILLVVNLLLEIRRRGRAVQPAAGRLKVVLQTVTTFTLITTLWSLGNSPTLGAWLDLITYWRIR